MKAAPVNTLKCNMVQLPEGGVASSRCSAKHCCLNFVQGGQTLSDVAAMKNRLNRNSMPTLKLPLLELCQGFAFIPFIIRYIPLGLWPKNSQEAMITVRILAVWVVSLSKECKCFQ